MPDQNAATMFFTVALSSRGDDLLLREIGALRQAVRLTRADRPFGIAAWVVLPDHLHTIWHLPPGDADFAGRWRSIKARFSRGLPRTAVGRPTPARKEGGLWHPRLCARLIGSADELQAHLRFCRADPVLHGLVSRAEDWPFSSFFAGPFSAPSPAVVPKRVAA